MKTCTSCKVEKTLFEFYKDPSKPGGLSYHCALCIGMKKRDTPEAKAYFKNYRFMYKYGLTTEQVEQMAQDQEGKCAICDTELQSGRLQAVDHCHTTNKVRAILCHGCNKGLGMFRENTDSLRKAAEYLEQHRGENPPVNG